MLSINNVFILALSLLAAMVAAMPPKRDDADCDKICTAIWAPVCATDGEGVKTFPNTCTLTVFNCLNLRGFQLLRSGPCENEKEVPEEVEEKVFQEEDLKTLKPKLRRCLGCPRLYLPVCGAECEETRMFPNACEIEAYNCEESRNFSMLKEGYC